MVIMAFKKSFLAKKAAREISAGVLRKASGKLTSAERNMSARMSAVNGAVRRVSSLTQTDSLLSLKSGLGGRPNARDLFSKGIGVLRDSSLIGDRNSLFGSLVQVAACFAAARGGFLRFPSGRGILAALCLKAVWDAATTIGTIIRRPGRVDGAGLKIARSVTAAAFACLLADGLRFPRLGSILDGLGRLVLFFECADAILNAAGNILGRILGRDGAAAFGKVAGTAFDSLSKTAGGRAFGAFLGNGRVSFNIDRGASAAFSGFLDKFNEVARQASGAGSSMLSRAGGFGGLGGAGSSILSRAGGFGGVLSEADVLERILSEAGGLGGLGGYVGSGGLGRGSPANRIRSLGGLGELVGSGGADAAGVISLLSRIAGTEVVRPDGSVSGAFADRISAVAGSNFGGGPLAALDSALGGGRISDGSSLSELADALDAFGLETDPQLGPVQSASKAVDDQMKAALGVLQDMAGTLAEARDRNPLGSDEGLGVAGDAFADDMRDELASGNVPDMGVLDAQADMDVAAAETIMAETLTGRPPLAGADGGGGAPPPLAGGLTPDEAQGLGEALAEEAGGDAAETLLDEPALDEEDGLGEALAEESDPEAIFREEAESGQEDVC